MSRLVLSMFGVFVMVAALAVPAEGAASARVPPRDSVVGGGAFSFGGPWVRISVEAQSDAVGGDPSGRVSFVTFNPDTHQFIEVAGPVTCLGVNGHRAVIGFVDVSAGLGPIAVVVSDGGPFELDGFAALREPTDCLTVPGVLLPGLFGDFAVRDVPSKDQCKDGGWRNYTDAIGQPFPDQGDCIAFALGAA